MSFELNYINYINDINKNGNIDINKRTGSETKRKFGLDIELENCSYVPLLNSRKLYIKTAAAELAWTLKGEKSTKWLNQYTKIWEPFEDSLGIVESSYGYRWRKHFGRDQLLGLIKLLKKDPSSRQGVVIAWDAGNDGLVSQGKLKNVPCPYSFVVNTINNKTNMLVSQRSADMILGIPYDIMMYSMLNNAISQSLSTQPGTLKFSIADAHLYQQFYSIVDKLVQNYKDVSNPWEKEYKSMPIEEIINKPEKYIETMCKYAKDYNPINNIGRLIPNK